jgi:hypothetical protein
MPNMEPQDKILDKLAKMLRHQESARQIGNAAEAEAFATRIQEWLTRHKLEISDIQFVEQEETEPVDVEILRVKELNIGYERRRIEWQEDLAYQIALANDCRTLLSNHSNTAFFVGRKTDREICVSLFRYFITLILAYADKAAEEAKDSQRSELKARHGSYYTGASLRWRMRDFRASYCAGFSQAIQNRLADQRREKEKLLKKAEASTAMIHLRNTEEAIDGFLADYFKDRKPRQQKDNIDDRVKNWSAYKQGQQAGDAVALTAGALK